MSLIIGFDARRVVSDGVDRRPIQARAVSGPPASAGSPSGQAAKSSHSHPGLRDLLCENSEIPPTAVGGWFRSNLLAITPSS
jgi:hypothetical protein